MLMVAIAGTSTSAITTTPAGALNTVVVTTTADVTNAGDGLLSLREAIDIANTDADDTVVALGSGLTYQLTDCVAKEPVDLGGGFFAPPPEDDANLDGDLDHTAADALTIDGNGSIIQNTCPYDRVLHSQHEDATVVLDHVTIAGGISPPGSGTNIWVLGSMTMNEVFVSDGVSDVGAQSAGVVVGFSAPDNLGLLLTMTNSSILGNGKGGVRVVTGDATVTGSTLNDNDGPGFTNTFGTLTMDTTTLVDNNGDGVSGIDSAMTITNSAAGNNNGWGFRGTGNAETGQAMNLTNVNSIDNRAGGVSCSYCTDLNLVSSTVSSNDGVGVSMLANVAGPTMAITNSTIEANVGNTTADFEAGGVDMNVDPGLDPTVSISRSTIANNTSGAMGDGGGIRVVNAGLDIAHSTITGNEALDAGGGIAGVGSQPVTLEFVTLVENATVSGGANLHRETGSVDTSATVIGLPIGGSNCAAAGGSMVSSGFTQVSDTSCMPAGAPGDLIPAPNPMLGPLTPNGGPTPTRLPLMGSPLLGAVTGTACDMAAEDQRGISRPQGAACEVGAVEENEVIVAFMLVGRDPLLKPDIVLRNWLEGRGYQVVAIDDDLGRDASARFADADLIVISSSVRVRSVTPFVDELRELEMPILTTEGYLHDELGLATRAGETKKKTQQIDVLDSAAGLEGRVTVLTRHHRLAYGLAGTEAEVIATAADSPARALVFSYGAGDELADATIAAGARGAFLFDYRAPSDARAEAFVLLDLLLDRIAATGVQA
jgi:hypothetical protein